MFYEALKILQNTDGTDAWSQFAMPNSTITTTNKQTYNTKNLGKRANIKMNLDL